MNYSDDPRPWCIMRLQPNLQHQVLNRFQSRYEAEAHLRVLQQMMPTADYMLLFDSAADVSEVEFGYF